MKNQGGHSHLTSKKIIMANNKIRWGLVVFVTAIIIATASSQSYRFTPTHAIIKESHCHTCHSAELQDTYYGDHIPSMPVNYQARFFGDFVGNYYSCYLEENLSDDLFLDSFCQTCHMNTLQFYRFEVSDPYISNFTGNNDAIYGTLDFLNHTNVTTTNDQVVEMILALKTVNPPNATIDVTATIFMVNFSGHQTNSTSFTNSGKLSRSNNLTMRTSNVNADYFYILLMLENWGWNNSGFEVAINGSSDDGNYLFPADEPGNYFLPYDMTGDPFFHTEEYYKAISLDIAFSDFKGANVNNITALEGVNRTDGSGNTTNMNTCYSPGGVCHITQKITSLGSTTGFDGPDGKEGFYMHDMPYTTSSGLCLLCHLNGL